MAQVVFTEEARSDLRGIHAYISQDSPRFADVQVQRFIEMAERLAQYPRSGKVIPEINDPLHREVIVGSYRMMYRIRSNHLVEVMIIHHGARKFPFKRFA